MKPRVRFACAVVSLAFLQAGCFAIDEIDKANEILKAHDGKPDEPVVVEPPAGSATDGPGVAEWLSQKRGEVSEMWRQALEEEPVAPPADDGVVRCEIKGATHFVRKSDCELRGGRYPASASPTSKS